MRHPLALLLLGGLAAGPAAANTCLIFTDQAPPGLQDVLDRVNGTPDPVAACTAVGSDLASARAAFASACPATARADCDPMAGGYLCSSAQIGASMPGAQGAAPATPPSSPAPRGTLRVEAEDLNLGAGWSVEASRGGFSGTGYAVWRGPGQGGGPGAVGGAAGANGATVVPFDVPTAGTYRVTLRGTAFDAARADLANDSWVRGPGVPWTKLFTTGKTSWATGSTADRGGRKYPFDVQLPAGRVELGLAGRSVGHGVDWIELVPVGGGATAAVAADSDADLISLHYDSAPDWDDLQAMVAARHVFDTVGDRDKIVVNATFGYQRGGSFIADSMGLVREVFPDALDAREGNTRARVATAWQLTLDAGGTVNVAEGGPSDFTSDVLRILRDRGVSNLKRVRVVQHSHGGPGTAGNWNEANTKPENMALVKSLATYVTIDNGNNDGNRTADFNQQGTTFEARSRASRYGPQWARAYRSVRDGRRVDFSDTVELLHILGLPNTGGVSAFADRYFR